MPLIRRDGSYFGTLCALDPRPASLDEQSGAIFQLLAQLIAFELEADENRSRREQHIIEMEQAAAFRERFIDILGHDLRNPINAITLSAFTLANYGRLTLENKTTVQQISESASRMGRMVSDLLDFTRSRLGGGMPIAPLPMDLFQVWEGVIRELTAVHPDRRILFHWEGSGKGVWDPDRMAQVASNLLSNALQYSPAASDVRVAGHGEDDGIRVEVNNDGPPIAEESIRRLFDPYYRAGEKDRSGGLGLGLHIAEQIVGAHGGSVTVLSTQAEGTTFTICLQRTPQVPVGAERPRLESQDGAGGGPVATSLNTRTSSLA